MADDNKGLQTTNEIFDDLEALYDGLENAEARKLLLKIMRKVAVLGWCSAPRSATTTTTFRETPPPPPRSATRFGFGKQGNVHGGG